MGGKRVYCLAGTGLVAMANGEHVRVDAIQVGDAVRTVLHVNREVRAVGLESENSNAAIGKIIAITVDAVHDFMLMSRVQETCLTPGHPVRVRRESDIASAKHGSASVGKEEEQFCWRRPCDLVESFPCYVDYLYNFVLDTRSSIIVDELEVCSLGQFCEGIDDEKSFFGSERVVRSLLNNQSNQSEASH
jgi:hypothetical protein